MSNHGIYDQELPPELKRLLEKSLISRPDAMRLLYPDRAALGATGRFPLGKLTSDDEGELKFALAADPQTKTIIFDFGKPIAWFAMPRSDAEALLQLLQEKIKELS